MPVKKPAPPKRPAKAAARVEKPAAKANPRAAIPSSDPLGAAKRKARREGWGKWIRSEADEHAMLTLGCRFSIERAERVSDFFTQFLRHSKGDKAGDPFELLDWQRDDVMFPLFGWIRPDDSRRYRKAYVEIPKKNGKSTLASGLGLYMLCGDGEAGAEIYAAANDQKQAGIVHREAQAMVEASPELMDVLTVQRTSNNIAYPETHSFYRALTAVPRSNEGWNGHCAIIDELHMWHGRELWDALRYMFAARRQPLLFVITTAGADPLCVCKEQHDYAQTLLKGQAFDDRFLPYIRAADPEDDWRDEKTWKKANPSFGLTLNAADFADDIKEAESMPSSLASLKRYRLNIWGTGESPWLPSDKWIRCTESYSSDTLVGQACWAGLDLAKTTDTTALALAFRGEGEIIRLLNYFWLPEETARNLRGQVPYESWAEQGCIELTPGDVCDYAFLRHRFGELSKKFRIQLLHYDPWQAEETTQQIEQGIRLNGEILDPGTGVPRQAFKQSLANYAGPTAEFERRVVAGTLRHNGHAVLGWQAGNVQVRQDPQGNKMPCKPKHGDPRKIDGIAASVMAVAGLLQAGPERGSVYEKRGMIYLDELF